MKLRQRAHVLGHLSHNGIAQRALPAPGVKKYVKDKIKVFDTHSFSMER